LKEGATGRDVTNTSSYPGLTWSCFGNAKGPIWIVTDKNALGSRYPGVEARPEFRGTGTHIGTGERIGDYALTENRLVPSSGRWTEIRLWGRITFRRLLQ
jgi:hypothetical protein